MFLLLNLYIKTDLTPAVTIAYAKTEVSFSFNDFFIKDNFIYVISNIYSDDSEREVDLYILNIEDFKIVETVFIDNMTFAFHINYDEDNIYIYGNEVEEELNLSVSIYNTKSKYKQNKTFDNKSIWIKKTLFIEDKIYIINDLSIIEIDKNLNFIDELKIDNFNFIDFFYDANKKLFYSIIGDYTNDKYKIIKFNRSLKIKDDFYIDTESTIPINIYKE